MADPNSSMSPAAVLMLTLVVLILLGAWLGAVFYAGRQPATRRERHDGDGGEPATRQEGARPADERSFPADR